MIRLLPQRSTKGLRGLPSFDSEERWRGDDEDDDQEGEREGRIPLGEGPG